MGEAVWGRPAVGDMEGPVYRDVPASRRIFIELMTSGRKLKASREGSK